MDNIKNNYVYIYDCNKNTYNTLKIKLGQNNQFGGNNKNVSYNKRINTYNEIKNKSKLFFSPNDCKLINVQDKNITIDSNKKAVYVISGGQGAVYFLSVKNSDKIYYVALKFVCIYDYLLEKKNLYNPCHKRWRELYVLKKCTEYVKNKVTQNLPLMYYDQLCKGDNKSKNDCSKSSILTYVEMANGNLVEWLKDEHTIDDWKSMFFQVWHSLDVLQKKLKLLHNDLRFPNILFIKTDNVNLDNESYRYKIENEYYYLNNPKYIFLIWDYGSCQLLKYPGTEYQLIKRKIEYNYDLFFLHDMYNRIRVLCLTNRYDINELENIIQDKKWIKENREYNENRFPAERFMEKYKISMAYYLIENGEFEKYYTLKKNISLEGFDKIYMPPKEIDKFLEKLSKEYNYNYDDILQNKFPDKKNIPSIKNLIDTFLPEFKITQKNGYSVSFE